MKIRDRIVDFRRVSARDLLPNPKNWRRHPQQQQDALRGLLSEIGYADALLVRETPQGLQLLDGHLRAETTPDMDVPVLVLDLDDAEADKLLVTLDPLASMAEADVGDLRTLLEQVSTGNDAVQTLLNDLAYQVAPVEPGALGAGGHALTDRFVVPPFSVLDARQGYWQERKRAWLALGIQGEAGRGNYNEEMTHPATTATIDFYSQKRALEAELGRDLTTDEAKAILTERGTVKDDRETQRQRATGRPWSDDKAMTESTLEHYRKGGRGRYKHSSAPSGQPRPATKLGPDGKTVRGDGHGRPIDRKVKMAQALRAGHTGSEANRRTDVEGHGSLPIRAPRAFAASRKLGKTHQNVLVFFKGDVRRLPQVYPSDIDVAMPEAEEAPA